MQGIKPYRDTDTKEKNIHLCATCYHFQKKGNLCLPLDKHIIGTVTECAKYDLKEKIDYEQAKKFGEAAVEGAVKGCEGIKRTAKVGAEKARPCESNPNVLHKSGPVPYMINEGNVDQCANCVYLSRFRFYFDANTEKLIELSKDEKYCLKWNKKITDNVTMCIHHDIGEDAAKLICEDCKHMVDATTADGNSKPICIHPDVGGKPCCEAYKCSGYSKKQDTPLALLGHNDPEMVTPVIKDSGARREFETGAVRDIQEGKGRCDLLPLDVVALCLYGDFQEVIECIYKFTKDSNILSLVYCIRIFVDRVNHATDAAKLAETFLEVSKHFEEGAKKYGEYNWQKGIPTHCYIDSAVRHYLKYLRGDKDEPHDRAFVWNILCCIWTCIHKPELNDYAARATCMETKELFENAINAMKRYSEDTQPKKEEKH